MIYHIWDFYINLKFFYQRIGFKKILNDIVIKSSSSQKMLREFVLIYQLKISHLLHYLITCLQL